MPAPARRHLGILAGEVAELSARMVFLSRSLKRETVDAFYRGVIHSEAVTLVMTDGESDLWAIAALDKRADIRSMATEVVRLARDQCRATSIDARKLSDHLARLLSNQPDPSSGLYWWEAPLTLSDRVGGAAHDLLLDEGWIPPREGWSRLRRTSPAGRGDSPAGGVDSPADGGSSPAGRRGSPFGRAGSPGSSVASSPSSSSFLSSVFSLRLFQRLMPDLDSDNDADSICGDGGSRQGPRKSEDGGSRRGGRNSEDGGSRRGRSPGRFAGGPREIVEGRLSWLSSCAIANSEFDEFQEEVRRLSCELEEARKRAQALVRAQLFPKGGPPPRQAEVSAATGAIGALEQQVRRAEEARQEALRRSFREQEWEVVVRALGLVLFLLHDQLVEVMGEELEEERMLRLCGDKGNDEGNLGRGGQLAHRPGSCGMMALRYANLIVSVAEMVRHPGSVDLDTRDKLFQMLPWVLRRRLKSKVAMVARFPLSLTTTLGKGKHAPGKRQLARGHMSAESILQWLLPMARATVRLLGDTRGRAEGEDCPSVSRQVAPLETLIHADQNAVESLLVDLLLALHLEVGARLKAEVEAKRACEDVYGMAWPLCGNSWSGSTIVQGPRPQ